MKHLHILARLYIQRAAYEAAAAAFEALAKRRSGVLPQDRVPLEQRLDSLQSAVMQVCSRPWDQIGFGKSRWC